MVVWSILWCTGKISECAAGFILAIFTFCLTGGHSRTITRRSCPPRGCALMASAVLRHGRYAHYVAWPTPMA